MKMRLIHLFACGTIPFGSCLSAAETVSHIIKDSVVLVNAAEAGKQFGWEPKMEGDILVLCRDQLCVPVNLDKVSHFINKGDDQCFVDANTLGKIMGFTPEISDKELSLKPVIPKSDPKDDSTTYHAGWPEGRGFEQGETLPNIPLIDLEGNEVRFGDFLGKRYVIYGWASW